MEVNLYKVLKTICVLSNAVYRQRISKKHLAESVKVIIMPAFIFIFRCFESLPTSSLQLQKDIMAAFSYCIMQLELFRK